MPFTLSHAGFVLPLRRHCSTEVFLALIIGSLVPDVPYFLRAFSVAPFAHSMLGAVIFGVPTGLLLYAMAMALYNRVATSLPRPHRDFLRCSKPLQTRHATLAVAILAGAWSHNVIDSFTHETGYAVALWPSLATEAFRIGKESLPWFRVLQYTGSLLGAVLIVATYSSAIRRHCEQSGSPLWQDAKQWRLLLILLSVSGLVAFALHAKGLAWPPNLPMLRAFAFQFLITWMPLFGLALIVSARLRPMS